MIRNDLLEMNISKLKTSLNKMNDAERKSFILNIPKLTNILKLNTVSDFSRRVTLREEYIKNNPNDVHWDYAEFWNDDLRCFQPHPYILISTAGTVIKYLRRDQWKIAVMDCVSVYNSQFYSELFSFTFKPVPKELNRCNYIDLVPKSIINYTLKGLVYDTEWTANPPQQLDTYMLFEDALRITDIWKFKVAKIGLDGDKIKEVIRRLPLLTETLELDKVDAHEERVALRYEYLKANPGKRYWDHAWVYPYGKSKAIKLPGVLVSNFGDFITIKQYYIKSSADITTRINLISGAVKTKKRYRELSFDGSSIKAHRIVASTFVPVPEHHICNNTQPIVTNHVDNNGTNNQHTNLEWVLHKGNIEHYHTEIKPFK